MEHENQKVRKEFADIVTVHKSIIRSLVAQKARQDSLLQKYEQDLKEEIEIPSNRLSTWHMLVSPYLDSVISSKLMDQQLLEEYSSFLKEMVAYEQQYIISEADIADLQYFFDLTTEIILRLEKKIVDFRNSEISENSKLLAHAVKLYQKMPAELKKPGECKYCGSTENSENDPEICIRCEIVPAHKRPVMNGDTRAKYSKWQEEDNISKQKRLKREMSEAAEEDEDPEDEDPEEIEDDVSEDEPEEIEKEEGPEKKKSPEKKTPPKKDKPKEKKSVNKAKREFTRLISDVNRKYPDPKDEVDILTMFDNK